MVTERQILPRFSFGDGPEMADWLLGLVLEGKKTATCCAAVHGPPETQVGDRYIILDGQGRPRVVLETTEMVQRRFDEVDDAFAFEEGEDERTLESWRRNHQDFFTNEGVFAPDMWLWCERFKLVEILDEAQP